MIENWKAVPSYDGQYEVSDQGRVRSLGRYVTQTTKAGQPYQRWNEGRILKAGLASNGYLTVCLGKGVTRTVHSLVAEAFLGPCPVGQEVRHLDGTRINNAVDNLAYGTRTDNILDAVANGTWMSPKRRVWLAILPEVRAR